MRTQGKDTKLETHQIIFGTIETVGLLIGGVVNLLLLTFHLKQPKKTTTIFLYCLMNGTDLLICILMIPSVISCWAGSKALFFESLVAKESWLYIWEVSGRISVFLIGLQSVLRTRALLSPFARRIKRKVLATIIILYLIILSSIQSVRFFYHVNSVFSPNTNRPTMIKGRLQDAMGRRSIKSIAFILVNNFFGYVAPFLPITISCLISVRCIKKSGRKIEKCTQVTEGTEQNHQTATRTVIMLTLVYIVTNALTFIFDLNEMMVGFTKIFNKRVYFIDWYAEDMSLYKFVLIYVTAYNVCILLNSTLNGLVFFMRTSAIRAYTMSIIQKLLQALHFRAAEPQIVLSNKSVVVQTEVSRADTLI